MTPDAAISDLLALCESDDPEESHGTADAILCEFLISLGYENVVEIYREVKKWYA